MKNNILLPLSFIGGAAIGSAVTWNFVKEKYRRIAKKEIESVKKIYGMDKKSGTDDNTINEAAENETKTDNMDALEYLTRDYKSHSDTKPAKEEVDEVEKPYVIPPEECGETDYEVVSLIYYADGVLADEQDNLIEDIEGAVGEESLNHFGEYENDSVFVRNDQRKTDYEICLDARAFSELVGDNT